MARGGMCVFVALIALYATAASADAPLALLPSAAVGSLEEVALTPEQQAWVADHPVIRVAATPDWPPFEFVDEQGAYRGINADMLRLVAEWAGFDIEPVAGAWPELERKLRDGRLDLCPGLHPTRQRREFLRFSRPFGEFPHGLFVRDERHDIEELGDLAGQTVAIENGYYLQGYLEEELPGARLMPVANALAAITKVAGGEADAYIGTIAVTTYLIERNAITNLKSAGAVDIEPLKLCMAVRRDYEPLAEILDTAIAALPAERTRAILSKYSPGIPDIVLSGPERAWIEAHPHIRLGIDPEFAPFEYLDDDGVYRGMASEYIALLNQRLGLNMEVVHTGGWAEAVALAKSRDLDVLPCVGITEARRKHFLFSEPYLHFYRVVVTRADAPFLGGLEDLAGRRVGVQANTSHHGFLAEETNLDLALFDTMEDTLAAVAQGKAEAAVGNAAAVTYWIRKLGLTNLRIAAPAGEARNPLCFAIRNDWPELVSVIDKGLDSITEEEAIAIRQRWIGVEVPADITLRRTLRVVGLLLAALLVAGFLLMLHTRRLSREVKSRRNAEAALRDSEDSYRTLVEGANSIILRMSPEGEVLFLNAFGEAFFGFSGEEIVGRSVIGTIVPETETSGRDLREMIQDIGLHPSRYQANENENITKSGERVWVAWTNRPLYGENGDVSEVLCVGNDVTARRKAEAVRYRYEFIVNTVDEMMSVINADLHYEAVNDAWCDGMDKQRRDVVGKPVADAWPDPDYREHILPNLRRCLAGELVAMESTVQLPADGRRYCEITMYPYAERDEETSHVVVLTRDVTEQREAAEALEAAKLAAEAANRAKSTFLANMSHEIRTPMNAVLGYTQLLQRDPNQTPEHRHALNAIARSGDHLLALINDVLEMSKIEAGRMELKPSTFDLRALLSDMALMFRMRADAKGLKLDTALESDVPRFIRADENRVRQVLINLLGNALKFTDRGGISLRAYTPEPSSDNGAIEAVKRPEPSHALTIAIEVEDTGCGLKPEDHDRIFGSFQQASEDMDRRGGTGLGLTISRSFARAMKGDLTVESVYGEGSRFRFLFLAETSEESLVCEEKPPRKVLHLKAGQSEVRALIVDDRETNRDLLKKMLDRVGFVTRTAENGKEGVEAFEAWRPQVVLIDLVMPVMDGREAIRLMRSSGHGHDAAIFAVTASTLDEEQASILAQGADEFLRKPFSYDDLLERISRHTRVEYEYDVDGDDDTANETEAQRSTSARNAISRLPGALAEALRAAVETGSIDDCLDLVPKVQQYEPGLAVFVRDEVRRFELSKLASLFEAMEGKSE